MANWTGWGFQKGDRGDEKLNEGGTMDGGSEEWKQRYKVSSSLWETVNMAPKWKLRHRLLSKAATCIMLWIHDLNAFSYQFKYEYLPSIISDCANVMLVIYYTFCTLLSVKKTNLLGGSECRQTCGQEGWRGKLKEYYSRDEKKMYKDVGKSVTTNLTEPCDQSISSHAV